jgi:hypothetical protein
MDPKKIFISGLTLLLAVCFSFGWVYSQGTPAGQANKVDPELCALMLRKGKETFSRAKYHEAKEFFRKAVQADPTSQKAWSYYDLALFYTVGEQYKNHGKVVLSSAPQPDSTLETAPPGASAVPATEPALKELKGKPAPPGVKEKPYPAPVLKKSTVKEKPYPAPEIKKPAEPKKPAVTAPVPPTPPAKAAPAAPATAPPTPAPSPAGPKMLKDEGC